MGNRSHIARSLRIRSADGKDKKQETEASNRSSSELILVRTFHFSQRSSEPSDAHQVKNNHSDAAHCLSYKQPTGLARKDGAGRGNSFNTLDMKGIPSEGEANAQQDKANLL